MHQYAQGKVSGENILQWILRNLLFTFQFSLFNFLGPSATPLFNFQLSLFNLNCSLGYSLFLFSLFNFQFPGLNTRKVDILYHTIYFVQHVLIASDLMVAHLASGYVVEEFLGTLYLGFFSTFQLHGI